MYVYIHMCVCVPVLVGFDVDLGDVVTYQNVTTVTVMVTLMDDSITSTVNVTIVKVTVPGGGESDKSHLVRTHKYILGTEKVTTESINCVQCEVIV